MWEELIKFIIFWCIWLIAMRITEISDEITKTNKLFEENNKSNKEILKLLKKKKKK